MRCTITIFDAVVVVLQNTRWNVAQPNWLEPSKFKRKKTTTPIAIAAAAATTTAQNVQIIIMKEFQCIVKKRMRSIAHEAFDLTCIRVPCTSVCAPAQLFA